MSVLNQVVRQSDSDVVTVIGAGITLHEALAAAEILASEGVLILPSSGQMHTFQNPKQEFWGTRTDGEDWVLKSTWIEVAYLISTGKNIRVIDPFTIKPLDASTIVASARATGGQIITVEDHYKEGWWIFEL